MSNYYKPGTWNCICQVCGRQFKSDEVRKRWDGLIVCKSDYEERHILDFIRVQHEHSTVPYVAPEPNDVFVDVSVDINLRCPFPTMAGMADIGTADCAVAGLDIHIPDILTLAIADIAIAESFTPAEGLLL